LQNQKNGNHESYDDSEITPAGPCCNCGHIISILVDQHPTIQEEQYGTLVCPECEFTNGFLTFSGQAGITVGSENELWAEFNIRQEARQQKSQVHSNASARNQRLAYCHYCQSEVPKSEGFMLKVPSVNGKPMRRTVCTNCLGIPQQEWEEFEDQANTERVATVLIIVFFFAVMFFLFILEISK